MTVERIMIILLLMFAPFGLIGGCDNSNSNNESGDEVALPGPGTGEFDLKTAIDLAQLSVVAYNQRIQCINSGKEAITVPPPYTLQEVFFEAVNSTLNDSCLDDSGIVPIAFIATNERNVFLSFRGTDTVEEVLADFLAFQIPYDQIPDGGNVSEGFLNIYKGTDSNPLQPAIISKLDDLIMTGNYDNLYITGHSLGAAVAVLAFPDLSQNTSISKVFMYNFAGPVVGDGKFVSAYEGEYSADRVSWRIVNTNDLVPKLPPIGLDCPDFMYEHVSGEQDITFGVELPMLPDFSNDDCNLLSIGEQVVNYGLQNKDGIETNHDHCTYFMTLCMMGSDPSTCKERAIGCN